MRTVLAFTLALFATPALADWTSVPSAKPVGKTMDALQAAVEGAGATVFARVNHGAGAASVGLDLQDAELLIFGNPKLGTPAMQDDIRTGLVLPLRVLVHATDTGSVIVYENVPSMLEGYDTSADAGYKKMMAGALAKLTAKAAE